MKRLTNLLLFAVLTLGFYLLLWPVAIDPVVWTPAPNPGLTGPYAQSSALLGLTTLLTNAGLGPEDVTRGPDGRFYTGLQDGRILRFPVEGNTSEEFVNTGGRPLGIQFDAQGNLIVADAFKGLLAIAPNANITVLADSINGQRMVFPDDLDIAADGTIWFTDASQRFDQHHWINDFWEARPTGRLLSYDPQTKQTTVRMSDLRFANGVALGPDDAFVLVNETIAARIWRLWLKGPKAGQREIFCDGLPGYPDNLSFNKSGTFWVALPAPRSAPLEAMAGHPFLRKLLFRLPERWVQIQPPPVAWVLGLDEQGQVRHSLRDTSGAYASVTSANEFGGHLYLGSILMKAVARVPTP
ncbi:MAG: SMP-30/gluconolactonase/LRE family protein [Acidobacteria bacterium]|nr:SMP-30/gluconolactonase/LRE family protein [Acidobacteriota bacterium]MBI3425827.1 SMP-30/gluconolactonase/LRE family protein [Acidobacteriota bacterium]